VNLTIHLTIPLVLPLVAGLIALFVPRRIAGWVAFAGSLAALAYGVALLVEFDEGRRGLQNVTDEVWIEALGIHYKLGVDGLNLFLILLTSLLFSASLLWSNLEGVRERPGQFAFWMSFGHTTVLGALLAQDLALFVVFFDLMLVPFFFLTGIWGGPERIPAVIKLFIYTLVGSLLMLAAAIATAVLGDAGPGGETSFVLSDLVRNTLSETEQRWIFLAFAAAFLVKMPAFPLHGWMPDGYRNMPLPVLAVFSGVLSKVAAYGFLRIVLPLFPEASASWTGTLVFYLALASILYGSVMAFTTTEARLILGYSSVAQLGFIVLGIFSLRPEGAQGAILQSVNHGLVVAPFFFIVALLAARAGGSQDIRDMGGIAMRAPVLATFFLVIAMCNLAIPGSTNFVGEFLILLGVFRDALVPAIVAATGVVLAAVYTLRAFIRSVHGRVGPAVQTRDLRFADVLVLAPLVLVILALSLYPQLALERSERSAAAAVERAAAIDEGAPGVAAR
jgi:NADH-quinone oxidoreductase subunit M